MLISGLCKILEMAFKSNPLFIRNLKTFPKRVAVNPLLSLVYNADPHFDMQIRIQITLIKCKYYMLSKLPFLFRFLLL